MQDLTGDQIKAAIYEIKQEPSDRRRFDLAQNLANSIRMDSRLGEVSEDAIVDVASLLRDPNDGVRTWAAAAVAQFGARALPVVPELEAALRRIEAENKKLLVGPDFSSAVAIRGSLKKITGKTYE